MSKNQTNPNQLIQELSELKALEAELKSEIEAKQDQIKEFLNTNNLVEYIEPDSGHKVTFKTVITNKLMTKKLEADIGKDVLAEYYSESQYKRFTFK